MATTWRTGMRPTKARLDDGSSGPWTANAPIRAEQLRDRLSVSVTAGDRLTPSRLNGGS